jgi:hypothetical protein
LILRSETGNVREGGRARPANAVLRLDPANGGVGIQWLTPCANRPGSCAVLPVRAGDYRISGPSRSSGVRLPTCSTVCGFRVPRR